MDNVYDSFEDVQFFYITILDSFSGNTGHNFTLLEFFFWKSWLRP